MKTMMLMLVLAISLVSGCGGGGDTAEKVFADMATNLREMSSILTSVTDEASATAAVPKIEAVRMKMRDCAKRAKTVSMPDAATEERLNASMLAVQAEVMPSIAAAKRDWRRSPNSWRSRACAQGIENAL